MIKFESAVMMTVLFLTAGLLSGISVADEVSPQQKKAETSMLSACKKEFPNQVANRTLDDVDHWAEAQENAADSATFKNSQCFAKHEKWEKLAQKNEWAVSTDPNHPTRLPASQK